MATRLEQLLNRLERIDEQRSQVRDLIKLEKQKHFVKERKRETRRKILLGSAIMTKFQKGELLEADLILLLDKFLTRPHDRDLFSFLSNHNERTPDEEKALTVSEA